MACRDLEKCAAAQKEIVDETHNHKVLCKKLDLASFKSIKEFTADVQKGATLSMNLHNTQINMWYWEYYKFQTHILYRNI